MTINCKGIHDNAVSRPGNSGLLLKYFVLVFLQYSVLVFLQYSVLVFLLI